MIGPLTAGTVEFQPLWLVGIGLLLLAAGVLGIAAATKGARQIDPPGA